MTEELKKEGEMEAPNENEMIAPEAVAEEPVEKESKKRARRLEAENADLKKQIEALQADLAAKADQHLRLAAEYDNFRRRTAKERDGIYADAFAEALATLFPVVDNLERAAQYSDGENVAKGVALTLKSVQDTLEKLGISAIDPMGEPFDPNLHNAVMHVEDETLGESVVAEVLQKGYVRGERVLRYAMVKVAN
ncbi:MAG: nucleotide exchange factor GrpE [Ruminococcaceae bacterium]|nr:nucleotide exchange factor GrpE [Oscillospiraceae bacterium]